MNTAKNIEQLIAISLLVLLMIGSFLVLKPFISALLWAALLCYATWPLFTRLNDRLKGRRNASAALLCIVLTAVVVVPFVVVALSLADNVAKLNDLLHVVLAQGLPLPPDWVVKLPLVGERLNQFWLSAVYDTATLFEPLKRNLPELSQWLLGRSVALGNGVLQMSLAIFILFFLYRDGKRALSQLRQVLSDMIGPRTHGYFDAVGNTTRAVLYGIVLTALAQGVLAGLGYWVAGVGSPLTMAVLTATIALIPFGTPFVWGSLSVWLYLQGHHAEGVGLFLWGALVVSWVDNVIRPLVISGPTRIPFLLVFLGVLGGLNAFGLIGLFLGPVLLAVSVAIWREWLVHSREQ